MACLVSRLVFSVSPFLPVSSRFSPFFIKLILQIYHQEFGTDCLGLVYLLSWSSFVEISSKYLHSKTGRARELKF